MLATISIVSIDAMHKQFTPKAENAHCKQPYKLIPWFKNHPNERINLLNTPKWLVLKTAAQSGRWIFIVAQECKC